MSEATTADQRLIDLEIVVRTLIAFNTNAISVLGRRIALGNPGIADAVARDLADLKSSVIHNIDKDLHDSYVDNLIVGITGKA